ELGIGLSDRDAGPESRDQRERSPVAMIGVQQRRHRYPDLGCFRKLEIRRHDADDGAGLVVDGDHASDNRWIAGVEPLPDGVAEESDAARTGSIFVGVKETSDLRSNAEQWK